MFRLYEQNRLGSHDLILLGTLLNIDAVTRHPMYQQFLRLGMSSFLAPPGEEHQRFIDSQETAVDKVLALSLFTLIEHENRHFWDMITTPAGLRLMGSALEIQLNYLASCDGLPFQGPVYFPFSEWVRDHEALAKLSPGLATPPPEVAAFASSAQHFEEEISVWNTAGARPGDSPSSTQILEGLAVLVQRRAVERRFGKSARTLFEGVMRNGDIGHLYLGAIDYVQHHLPEVNEDSIGLLLQMSLYGMADRPWTESSPAVLLPYLVDRFEHTRPQFPTSFVEQYVLCDGWLCARQGMSPALAFMAAGKALYTRLNEINNLVLPGAGLTPAARSVYSALLNYVGTTAKIGESIVQKVLFAGTVSNMRITQQSGDVYKLPQGMPYFESSYGLWVGGEMADKVFPLIGAVLAPGWKLSVEKNPYNEFLTSLLPMPDDQPGYLMNFFAPAGEHMPEYMQAALRLFPHMLMCRTAMVGPSETHSLAAALQSEFLSTGGHSVYSQGRLIAPLTA